MPKPQSIPDKVRAVLNSEPQFDLDATPIRLAFDGETLTMEGEVSDIAAKKRALEAAARVDGVVGIVDRVHVALAQPMGDNEIHDHVVDALLGEPAYADYAIRLWDDGEWKMMHNPDVPGGRIDVRVDDGIILLNGATPGLVSKRLAGVLAWWVPGARDVVNGIAEEPGEEDNAEHIEEAVRLVLEKDPFVNASQIRVGAREAVVRLTGVVASVAERGMAERDAWYVLGVDDVDNRIEVTAAPAAK